MTAAPRDLEGARGAPAVAADPAGSAVPPAVTSPAAGAGTAAGARTAAGAATARRRLLADLTPLRESPEYRRLWTGQSLSVMGTQMTNVALPVQVYALTRSSFDVGLLGLAVLLPLVLVGLLGGSIVDAMDRRTLALITSAVLALCSLLLAVQAVAGVHHVLVLYLLAGLSGAASALDSPARQTFIPRLLVPDQIPAATALSQISMQASLTGGPLVGGLLIAAAGVSTAYIVDAASFAFVLYATLRLRPMRPEGGGTRPSLRAVAEGLTWVRRHPVVGMTFYADICAMLFGMPRALFPALAISHFHGGSGIVGVLYAAPAIGGLLGAVVSGPLGRVRRQGLAILVSVFVWGLTVTGFGLTHTLWLAIVFLGIAGAADMVSGVFRSTILQVSAPDELRGRLGSVFFVVVSGGARLGDVEAGTVASVGGVGFSAISGGVACMVVIVALAFAVPAFTRYDAGAPTG